MKRFFIAIAVVFLAMSCGRGNKVSDSPYPDNFSALGDTGRVAYIMKTSTPDSVARFICLAALGDLPGATIDSINIATNYVYSVYDSESQIKFAEEYDRFVDSMSLARRMRLMALAGTDDPQGLGYELGLSYLMRIREANMSVDSVKKELEEFRTACANDSDTYRRFLIGFRTVLRADSGKDVNKEIYNRFINFE